MPVIGPLITEISVGDRQIAQYIENSVPLTAWTLFIVQCEEDKQTLRSLKLMKELNIIKLEGNNERFISPTFRTDLSR